MTQDVAILDIGSRNITVLTGRRGVNNTIIISGKGQSSYAGYSEGEWIEPEKLAHAMGQAISAAETSANARISEIYIGVPGDFTTVVCKELNLSFPRKRKVTPDDIAMLHEQGNSFSSDPNYSLIHSQPIYYTLDDDRRLIDPDGMPSTRLGGCISYILAEKRFLDNINFILNSLGIDRAEYVSSLLAETLFLFEDNHRDQYVVLIDVGHIATSVVVARGDGILAQYSVPQGGGYITGELAVELGTTYAQAESLKDKVLLSLDPRQDDIYQVTGKDTSISFRASEVNDIVIENIAKIASSIQKCLNMCKYDYPDHIPYYITGGGLANISGASDILAGMLERQVEIALPRLPHYGKPELSSMLGVLDLVISNNEVEKPVSFWKKLLSFLGKD